MNATTIVAGMLQRVGGGDPVAVVVDDALERLTGQKDATRHLSDRQLRRLGSVLAHHAKAYQATTQRILDAFVGVLEAEGLRLAYEPIGAPRQTT